MSGGQQQPPRVWPHYHNPSEEERVARARLPFPTRPSSPPTRIGLRMFGDDGRHPAEVEGWTPPVVTGGIDHEFVPGGDDATFGAGGTWGAVWLGEGDQADQCGWPREAHRAGLTLVEAIRRASTDPGASVARLECAPDVVGYLRSVAAEEPPVPAWRRSMSLLAPGSVPVVPDATMPAGRWRMVDRDGGVVWQGMVES